MIGCGRLGVDRRLCVPECVESTGRVGSHTSAIRVIRLVLTMLAVLPLAGLLMAVPGCGRRRRNSAVLGWISRRLLAALSVRVDTRGQPRSGPSLIVGNHTSWLDILLLCGAAPMVPVAKAEVAEWPIVGAIARRCGAIFLRRDDLRGLRSTVDEMATLLRQGHRVQLFPESTTRCGLAVGEFYRAGFQAALDAAVVVQPVTIALRTNGMPTTAAAFVGDETLLTALWRLLRTPVLQAEVRWLPPIPAVAGTGLDAVDRAVVARRCQQSVARALGQRVVPRRPDPVPIESRPLAA